MNRSQARLVALAATAFFMGGALLWVVPPRLPTTPAAPLALPESSEPSTHGPDDAYPSLDSFLAVTEGNVFTAERRGLEESAPRASAEPTPALRLLGIVSGPDGEIAIIQSPAAGSRAELYRIGETVGGFRLEAVGDSTVRLVGARGTLVLRLESPNGRGW